MTKRRIYGNQVSIIAAFLALWIGNPASALPITLIDQEPPTTPTGTLSLGYYTINAQILWGALIDLVNPTTLTDIQIYTSVSESGANQSPPWDLVFSVQPPDGNVPKPGDQTFSKTISIASTSDAGWISSGAINWALDAGQHWVTFGGSNSGDYGFLGEIPYEDVDTAPFPVASRNTQNGNWTLAAPISFGLRVFGDDGRNETVPVPTTFALLGLGLAGLGWSKRKKT